MIKASFYGFTENLSDESAEILFKELESQVPKIENELNKFLPICKHALCSDKKNVKNISLGYNVKEKRFIFHSLTNVCGDNLNELTKYTESKLHKYFVVKTKS